MSLIFDSFESIEKAQAFQTAVAELFPQCRRTQLWMNQDAMHEKCFSDNDGDIETDMFPFELKPPIVLVSRADLSMETEKQIEELVQHFGGVFAGT